MWSDEEDRIIGGDLTAALAYITPAQGAVVTPVAPLGLRDRESATVTFTTSLGFGRKLERIKENPQVALAYHAREHGFADSPGFVLLQGRASYDAHPDPAILQERIAPASTRFMGPPRRGVFWDRWLSAYYADRVLVDVQVDRVLSWPDSDCRGALTVTGPALPEGAPPTQQAPAGGTGPRTDCIAASRKLAKLRHALLGYRDADGYPLVRPVEIGAGTERGIPLSGADLPGGGRRAGLLAHSYEAQLIGLQMRQHTGWLQDGLYAPHTEGGFRAPPNKTVLLLANGFMARRGLKQARAQGRA
jgi:hypothetical protein